MENYQWINFIDKGNFGTISKIMRKSDKQIFVWKELYYEELSDKEKNQIINEVNILRKLNHRNIVKYIDRIVDKSHSKLYIIMEYCEGGDLSKLIKRCKKTNQFISEDIIWKIFSQVVLAVYTIHNQKEKILHRDIKASNIFIDKDNNIKLGDFGLSRMLSGESNFADSKVGTPYYMSPEQISGEQYNEKSDIWSLGCFLYELTTLHPPFEARNPVTLEKKIKKGEIDNIDIRYSKNLYQIIKWMLTVDYKIRPSAKDLLNLPEISIRIKETKIKEALKELKCVDIKLNERDSQNKIREEIIIKKENFLNEKEINLKLKENYLKEKEKKIKFLEEKLKFYNPNNNSLEKINSAKNFQKINTNRNVFCINNINNNRNNFKTLNPVNSFCEIKKTINNLKKINCNDINEDITYNIVNNRISNRFNNNTIYNTNKINKNTTFRPNTPKVDNLCRNLCTTPSHRNQILFINENKDNYNITNQIFKNKYKIK